MYIKDYINNNLEDIDCNLTMDDVTAIKIIIMGNEEGSFYELADIEFSKINGSWDYLNNNSSFYITNNHNNDISITVEFEDGNEIKLED